MEFFSAYSSKLEVNKGFQKPSRVRPEFQKESDINNIMKKYEKTGLIEHVNRFQGQYGDFVNVHDYQSGLNAVMEAQAVFDDLPSKIRARFANDPAQFLAFVEDPKNVNEMIELGLAKKRVGDVSDVVAKTE